MTIIHQLHKIIQLDDQPFVAEMYRRLLTREPDEDGFAHHIRMLKQGTPKQRLLISFLTSGEAIALYTRSTPSNNGEANPSVCGGLRHLFAEEYEPFVQSLYRKLLCREPDPSSYQGYIEQLRKGVGKKNIYVRFVNSTEFAELISLDKYTFARHCLEQLIQSFYTH